MKTKCLNCPIDDENNAVRLSQPLCLLCTANLRLGRLVRQALPELRERHKQESMYLLSNNDDTWCVVGLIGHSSPEAAIEGALAGKKE